ncbi:ABC transporter ATP-binding protein [Streptococcus hillyeri]|uniref:ABC transporter ATP-binding protein n=1 Tax=Streptococcus hillyeri TaxID=2282420 RepID=A0A3L9DNU4_9STRE|nr:ABC transporter ATP-binding protein [Streptococcus hillyeri]RLY02334.1 ABC transporter ATP-binding protein [Streptococcus hillyeri]
MTKPLVLKNITKAYQDGKEKRVILDGVNLELEKGEIIAILGPSGSGKSTLLSIIGCLLSADGGELHLGGDLVTAKNAKEWTKRRRDYLGFIFQNHHLLPYLSIMDQLKMVAKMTKSSASESDLLALLTELGIADCANSYPKDMSGGQKQRAAIARAFVGNPSLILADEPTASLDEERGRQIAELLRKEVKVKQTAAILVTHDERILDVVDNIYRLKNGKLVLEE